MIWRKLANHVDDCYFCLVNVAGFSSKNKSKIIYPNIPSSMRPVPHSDSIPVPAFNSFIQLFNETDTCTSEDIFIENDKNHPTLDQEKLPVLIKQNFLNDLVHNLNLPKDAAELSGSRLHHNNLLAPGTTFSFCRLRKKGLFPYFSMDNTFVFCHDIAGLLHAMSFVYDPK